MPFAGLDTAAVSRCLAQIADREGDLADAYFERLEEVELPPEEEAPGLRVRRESGLAVRLVRDGRTWLASRDGLAPQAFGDALRQVARASPRASYPEPELGSAAAFGAPPDAHEVQGFPVEVQRRIRERCVAFPLRLRVRRHRRWLQVVTTRLVPSAESESFYSAVAEVPWGRHGSLFTSLDGGAADRLAAELVELFRAREAEPPAAYGGVAVLGPGAAAVLLHEAVAHALEVDTLALAGRPEAAVGLRLAGAEIHVLDDPAAAPEGVRRATDDEGYAVVRRWLLRGGVVEQPLADAVGALASEAFSPGAGRRADRHLPPAPRSLHLELLPGESTEQDLLAEAEGGLLVREAAGGCLDPLSGEFTLRVTCARRIRGAAAGEPVGAFVLRGRVSGLLGGIRGIGGRAVPAGAGWCAKGGRRLAVWATAPSLRVEGLELAR